MILNIILVVLSAIFKAIGDTIKHHPDTSVFKGNKFWLEDGKFIPFTKYKLDGWHLSNSLMIICFLLLSFVQEKVFNLGLFIVLGALFILIFNLFYNTILRRL